MANNIEIKARVRDFDKLESLAKAISDTEVREILQRDVFINNDKGRLKLRIFSDNTGELIYYTRTDQAGPKKSEYYISRTNEPDTLIDVLERAYGLRGIVEKKRLLYMSGRTRIHLDRVTGLGDFMELEVVMGPEDTDEQGQAIASELMRKLEIDKGDLLEAAYIDLLEKRV